MTTLTTYKEFFDITSRAILKLPANLEESVKPNDMSSENIQLINALEVYAEALEIALKDFESKTNYKL